MSNDLKFIVQQRPCWHSQMEYPVAFSRVEKMRPGGVSGDRRGTVGHLGTSRFRNTTGSSVWVEGRAASKKWTFAIPLTKRMISSGNEGCRVWNTSNITLSRLCCNTRGNSSCGIPGEDKLTPCTLPVWKL